MLLSSTGVKLGVISQPGNMTLPLHIANSPPETEHSCEVLSQTDTVSSYIVAKSFLGGLMHLKTASPYTIAQYLKHARQIVYTRFTHDY